MTHFPIASEADEHPEDLLDRASLGGPLPASLREHVATCGPCATQLSLARRWSTGATPQGLESYLNRAAVHHVMRRWEGRRFPGQWARLPRWVQVGVSMLLLSGTAAAATWWSVRMADRGVSRSAPPLPLGQPPLSTRATAKASPGPSLSVPPCGEGGAADAPCLARKSEASVSPTVRQPAAELFDHARALRLGGNTGGARRLYHKLQRRYPGSRESHLSHVIVGRMMLEAGQARPALRQFEGYLADPGEAWEEALVGHASALERLGLRGEEAADWRTLLRRHPLSLYGPRAKRRLEALAIP